MRQYRRNTTNLISMILSIFILFAVLIVVPGVFDNVFNSYCMVLGAFLIFMPLFNALLQNVAVKMSYDPQKYFFTLAFKESVMYEWVVDLSAIVLLFFVPNTDLRTLGWPMTFSVVFGWMVVIAMTIFLSQKMTKVDFMSDTIMVKGINFFKSAGLSQKTTTGLGIYTYDEFEGFRLNEEKLVLLLTDGRGQVAVALPSDKKVQVTEYLKAKGVIQK